MSDQPDPPACICGHAWRDHDPIGRCLRTDIRERPTYKIGMPCGCSAYTEKSTAIIGFAVEREPE